MRFWAAITATLILLTAPAAAAERIALLIGNADYAHEGRLRNPVNDVAAMGRVLTAMGFAVATVENADERAMARALRQFGRDARGADTALFYSGHGMEIAGRNYLIPVDAALEHEDDVYAEAIELERAIAAASGAARLSAVIIDACRNSRFPATTRSAVRGFKPVEARRRQVVAFSTAPRQVAYDGEGALSPYTAALTEILPEAAGRIDVRILFESFGDRVAELAGGPQQPRAWSEGFGRDTVTLLGEPPPDAAQPRVDPRETVFFERAEAAEDPALMRAFLSAYPDTTLRALAEHMIADWEAALAPATIARPAQPAPTLRRDVALETFRIGLLGGENASDRLRSSECVREKLQRALGAKTTLFASADYNGLIEGLRNGSLDMAWLGASGYASLFLQDPDAVEPVLVRADGNGGFGYYAIGFTRKDSGVRSLRDMRGKAMGFPDPNSTSGWLIPSIEMPKAGVSVEPGAFFSDVTFLGGHENTILAVFSGEGPVAGVTWTDGQGDWEQGYNAGALRKAVDRGLIDMSELREIWRSNLVPNGPLVLRKALPLNARNQAIDLLRYLPKSDPDCAQSFFAGDVREMIPIDHRVYESVVEARRARAR